MTSDCQTRTAETVGLPETAAIPRPQPVGIRPFPGSHLLVPGDGPGRGLVEDYNAFVRGPTPAAWRRLEASGDPAIVPLARAVAFAHGLSDELPQPETLGGELRAVVLMTAAAGLVERGEPAAALGLLAEAVAAAREAAPAFAAVLEMQTADILQEQAGVSDGYRALAIEHLRQGLQLAAGTGLPLLRAELWLKLGIALQQAGSLGDRAALLEAVNAHQRALQEGITAESQPEWFGQIQNNLGLAYLSIPARQASDQLRAGIAVQSFRHALAVCDRDTQPDIWATVSMNLANALQYLPSSHPQENLIQAVERYEQVLEVRTQARDPVAHAIVLLNQANALAHLGIFKPAIEKLALAYKLFSWHEQQEQAAAAKELLDQIHQRLDELRDIGDEPASAPARGAD